MIQLGSYDEAVTESERAAYLRHATALSGARADLAAPGSDRLAFAAHAPDPQQPMTVAEMQEALRSIGFFPGGKLDGICGYRTRAAMRLFQEYVRSIENHPLVPDGRFGPITEQHLRRWLNGGRRPFWAETIDRWQREGAGSPEFDEWLSLLGHVKRRYAAAPTDMLRLVDAFQGDTDTRRVAAWEFPSRSIHVIGIRRTERVNKFDDLFVLLIKGLVFKFQGSTDPGATSHPRGAPFLVHGQHLYHFGWHKSQQLALRPAGPGVLVVRSKGDFRLDEADLRGGLEANPTIHIHWGGKGLRFDVNNWSEGCQVINGSAYLDPGGQCVNCASFVGTNNGEIARDPSKTRGAYNVIADLVLGLGNDLPGSTVLYTLLMDQDLDIAPSALLAGARRQATALLV